jgi:DUF3037 family protein
MMVLNYSIIRYLPDPRREEFLNVGLIVAAEDNSFVACRFTSDWRRVRRFGSENISFLKEIEKQLERFGSDQRDIFERESLAEQLKKLAANWQNSVQFSLPRVSVDPNPKALTDRLFAQYVQGWQTPHSVRLGKRKALHHAYDSLALALSERYPQNRPQIVRRETVKGTLSEHQFDLMVRNGKPLLCVDALSPREDEVDLDQQIRATAFDIQDVRRKHPALTLCIVIVDAPAPQFNRVSRIYRNLGADVTKDRDFHSWAKTAVRRLSH